MKYVRVSASTFDSIWNLLPITTGSVWLSAPDTPSDETEAHTASMVGSNNRETVAVFTIDPYVRQELREYWSRCKNLPQRSYYCSDSEPSRPAAAAALAIPDRAALIFSAYCSGIRVDFHPPACVIAAKSMSSSARSCAAPTRVECPLTSATNRAGIPIHRATRLKIGAMLPGCRASAI